jgi:hypothetical protein|tara:strand:+ start:1331 stop:1732 length:402 start_codon:yes stop_codon:yes gene_type:complete
MAHKSGHIMNMGSKEKNTPGSFSEKNTKTISQSTVGKMSDGVVVSGDKSKVNNKVNVPSVADKRAALKAKIAERKKINKAKLDEKRKEAQNLRQVIKDKIANRKLQNQRKKEGKDYQKSDGTVVRRRVKIVKK